VLCIESDTAYRPVLIDLCGFWVLSVAQNCLQPQSSNRHFRLADHKPSKEIGSGCSRSHIVSGQHEFCSLFPKTQMQKETLLTGCGSRIETPLSASCSPWYRPPVSSCRYPQSGNVQVFCGRTLLRQKSARIRTPSASCCNRRSAIHDNVTEHSQA
jgi:hypothetical protein